MSRPAIVRHHRDLGIMLAPLLLLSLYTGAVMVFRPVSVLLLGPGAPAEIARVSKPPKSEKRALTARPDWRGMVETAHRRFPEAQIRSLSLPRGDRGLITIRMRQPEEWLPNGRTMIWFAADTGVIAGATDARAHSGRVRTYNLFYPLHAAKVGGLPFRILMTLVGLALTLLGSLTVWTFWFRGGRPGKRKQLRQKGWAS
jgi:uncharacterized iron-regulated membrane protein